MQRLTLKYTFHDFLETFEKFGGPVSHITPEPPSLVPYNPNRTLSEIAQRLNLLGELVLAQESPASLAQELHLAALSCLQAHTRWQDLLQSVQDYRQERSELTAWFDDQVEQLQQEDLGLVVPGTAEDLSHLRPDAEGRYAWDRWQTQALAAGLSEDLAGLGRAVMREAVQHDWEPLLKLECGWGDGGQALLERALREGVPLAARWRELLATDGERGDWGESGL